MDINEFGPALSIKSIYTYNAGDISHIDSQKYKLPNMDVTLNDFFENANILITGSSGFIGKVLIEKLLRSQTNINKLYLLIRPKKGKTIEDRVKEDIFSRPIFEKVKETQPDFISKIVTITGDILKPQLGLSKEEKALLQNEINIIYNCAASVSMKAPLKDNVKCNVDSVIELMELSRTMKKLKCIVIVSTAYSNCNEEIIEEKVYKSSLSPEFVLAMCNEVDDETMEKITPAILGGHPNSYTYSKCLMENILERYTDLPIVLFRPAIVTPAYSEPLFGWVDNPNGPIGICLGCALGIIRIVYADDNSLTNWVPVDLCTNALICSAWHGTQKRLNNNNQLPVYNYACDRNKKTYGQLCHLMNSSGMRLYQCVWKQSYMRSNNLYLYYILRFFFHFIPALFMDLFFKLSGSKFRLNKIYKEKVYPFGDVVHYFAANSWTMKEDNTETMWQDLTNTDKDKYFFDSSNLDYDRLATAMCTGVKAYLMHEKVEDNYKAVRKQKIISVIHYTLLLSIFCGIVWTLFTILKYFCA